jgi:hypothetical protein
MWPEEIARMNDAWARPDLWQKLDKWPDGTPQEIIDKWPSPAALGWSRAGKTLQTAKNKSAL